MFKKMLAVWKLRQEGKVHRALVVRMSIFAAISLVLLGFVAFDLGTGTASAFFALPLFILGFILGLTLFSRMQRVVWDEDAEVVAAARMDRLGGATLLLYIAFEISLRHELPVLFPAVSTTLPLLLATVGGTLLGRFVGMLYEISRAADAR